MVHRQPKKRRSGSNLDMDLDVMIELNEADIGEAALINILEEFQKHKSQQAPISLNGQLTLVGALVSKEDSNGLINFDEKYAPILVRMAGVLLEKGPSLLESMFVENQENVSDVALLLYAVMNTKHHSLHKELFQIIKQGTFNLISNGWLNSRSTDTMHCYFRFYVAAELLKRINRDVFQEPEVATFLEIWTSIVMKEADDVEFGVLQSMLYLLFLYFGAFKTDRSQFYSVQPVFGQEHLPRLFSNENLIELSLLGKGVVKVSSKSFNPGYKDYDSWINGQLEFCLKEACGKDIPDSFPQSTLESIFSSVDTANAENFSDAENSDETLAGNTRSGSSRKRKQSRSASGRSENRKISYHKTFSSGDQVQKNCTFAMTGKDFTLQPWFNCNTCCANKDKGCCLFCARNCHKGHEVVFSKFSRFFCDCGARDSDLCVKNDCSSYSSGTSESEQGPKQFQHSEVVDYFATASALDNKMIIPALQKIMKRILMFKVGLNSKLRSAASNKKSGDFLLFLQKTFCTKKGASYIVSEETEFLHDSNIVPKVILDVVAAEPSPLFFAHLTPISDEQKKSISVDGVSPARMLDLLSGDPKKKSTATGIHFTNQFTIKVSDPSVVIAGFVLNLREEIDIGVTMLKIASSGRTIAFSAIQSSPGESKASPIIATILLSPLELKLSMEEGQITFMETGSGVFLLQNAQLFTLKNPSYKLKSFLMPINWIETEYHSSKLMVNKMVEKKNARGEEELLANMSSLLLFLLYRLQVSLAVAKDDCKASDISQELLRLGLELMNETAMSTFNISSLFSLYGLQTAQRCFLENGFQTQSKFAGLKQISFFSWNVTKWLAFIRYSAEDYSRSNETLLFSRLLRTISFPQEASPANIWLGTSLILPMIPNEQSSSILFFILMSCFAPTTLDNNLLVELAQLLQTLLTQGSSSLKYIICSHMKTFLSDSRSLSTATGNTAIENSNSANVLSRRINDLASRVESKLGEPIASARAGNRAPVEYRCDNCGDCPVLRARFHCENCTDFDLCLKCFPPAQVAHPYAHAFSLENVTVPPNTKGLSVNLGTKRLRAALAEPIGDILSQLINHLTDIKDVATYAEQVSIILSVAESIWFGSLRTFDLDSFCQFGHILLDIASRLSTAFAQDNSSGIVEWQQEALPSLLMFARYCHKIFNIALKSVRNDTTGRKTADSGILFLTFFQLFEALENMFIKLTDSNVQKSWNKFDVSASVCSPSDNTLFSKFWLVFCKKSEVDEAKGNLKKLLFARNLRSKIIIAVIYSLRHLIEILGLLNSREAISSSTMFKLEQRLLSVVNDNRGQELEKIAKSCLRSMGLTSADVELRCSHYQFAIRVKRIKETSENETDCAEGSLVGALNFLLEGIKENPTHFSGFCFDAKATSYRWLSIHGLDAFLLLSDILLTAKTEELVTSTTLRILFSLFHSLESTQILSPAVLKCCELKLLPFLVPLLCWKSYSQSISLPALLLLCFFKKKVVSQHLIFEALGDALEDLVLPGGSSGVLMIMSLVRTICQESNLEVKQIEGAKKLAKISFHFLQKSIKILKEVADVSLLTDLKLTSDSRDIVSIPRFRISPSCSSCWPSVEANKEMTLELMREEARYSSSAMFVKLTNPVALSSIKVTIHPLLLKKVVGIRTLLRDDTSAGSVFVLSAIKVSYCNSRSSVNLSDMRKDESLWKLAGTINFDKKTSEKETETTSTTSTEKRDPLRFLSETKTVELNFSAPVTATFLKFEYQFGKGGSSSPLQTFCPRCESVVQEEHGVCSNCGEVAFQCRLCRNINYENSNSFLCIDCGHCRFAKFSYVLSGIFSTSWPSLDSKADILAAKKKLRELQVQVLPLTEKLEYPTLMLKDAFLMKGNKADIRHKTFMDVNPNALLDQYEALCARLDGSKEKSDVEKDNITNADKTRNTERETKVTRSSGEASRLASECWTSLLSSFGDEFSTFRMRGEDGNRFSRLRGFQRAASNKAPEPSPVRGETLANTILSEIMGKSDSKGSKPTATDPAAKIFDQIRDIELEAQNIRKRLWECQHKGQTNGTKYSRENNSRGIPCPSCVLTIILGTLDTLRNLISNFGSSIMGSSELNISDYIVTTRELHFPLPTWEETFVSKTLLGSSVESLSSPLLAAGHLVFLISSKNIDVLSTICDRANKKLGKLLDVGQDVLEADIAEFKFLMSVLLEVQKKTQSESLCKSIRIKLVDFCIDVLPFAMSAAFNSIQTKPQLVSLVMVPICTMASRFCSANNKTELQEMLSSDDHWKWSNLLPSIVWKLFLGESLALRNLHPETIKYMSSLKETNENSPIFSSQKLLKDISGFSPSRVLSLSFFQLLSTVIFVLRVGNQGKFDVSSEIPVLMAFAEVLISLCEENISQRNGFNGEVCETLSVLLLTFASSDSKIICTTLLDSGIIATALKLCETLILEVFKQEMSLEGISQSFIVPPRTLAPLTSLVTILTGFSSVLVTLSEESANSLQDRLLFLWAMLSSIQDLCLGPVVELSQLLHVNAINASNSDAQKLAAYSKALQVIVKKLNNESEPKLHLLRAFATILETIGGLLKPEEQITNFNIFMQRSATQEDYFRGSLTRNPLNVCDVVADEASSGSTGLARMKDLRRKIAKDLDFEHATELIELVVDGKIINPELPLRLVYDKIWLRSNHCSQTDSDFYDDDEEMDEDDYGDDFGFGDEEFFSETSVNDDSALIAAQENTNSNVQTAVATTTKAKNGNAEDCMLSVSNKMGRIISLSSNHVKKTLQRLGVAYERTGQQGDVGQSDARPMVVIYRLCGIDGEPTEEYVEKLDENSGDQACSGDLLLKTLSESSVGFESPSIYESVLSVLELLNSGLSEGCIKSDLLEMAPEVITNALEILSVGLDLDANCDCLIKHGAVRILFAHLQKQLLGKETTSSLAMNTVSGLQKLLLYKSKQLNLHESSSESWLQESFIFFSSLFDNQELSGSLFKDEELLNKVSSVFLLEMSAHPQYSAKLAVYVGSVVRKAFLEPSDENSLYSRVQLKLLITGLQHQDHSSSLKSSLFERKVTQDCVDQINSILSKVVKKTKGVDTGNEAYKSSLHNIDILLTFIQAAVSDYEPAENYVLSSGVLQLVFAVEQLPTKEFSRFATEPYSNGDSSVQKACEEFLSHVGKNNENILGELKKWRENNRKALKTKAEKRRKKLMKKLKRRADPLSSKQESPTKKKKSNKPSTSWMNEINSIEEEKGLFCCICYEGYSFRPDKPLGIYVYTKPIPLKDMSQLFQFIFGKAAVGSALANESEDSTSGVTCIASSVTSFNVVHFCCHDQAVEVDQSRATAQAQKTEWEGARIRNGHVLCNNLLPLKGGEKSSILEATYTSTASRYLDVSLNKILNVGVDCNIIQSSAFYANSDQSGYRAELNLMLFNVIQDVSCLLLRFAYGEDLSMDTKGGGREDNMRLLVPLLQLCSSLFKKVQASDNSFSEKLQERCVSFLSSDSKDANDLWMGFPTFVVVLLLLTSHDPVFYYSNEALIKSAGLGYSSYAIAQALNDGFVQGSGAEKTRKRERSQSTMSQALSLAEESTLTAPTEDSDAIRLRCQRAGWILLLLLQYLERSIKSSIPEPANATIVGLDSWLSQENEAIRQCGELGKLYIKDLSKLQTEEEFVSLWESWSKY